jgi:hypothetical protein
MREVCGLIWSLLGLLLRSRASLEAEILILHDQLNVQRRHVPRRVAFSAMDRLIFVGLYRLVPNTIEALTIVKPDTVIRWHRAGFRSYWRWKSCYRCGRPTVPLEIRRLIREMSVANPLSGVPRIHGELLKLGIAIGLRSQVHGAEEGPSLAGMEHVPSQPGGWHGRLGANGPQRGSDAHSGVGDFGDRDDLNRAGSTPTITMALRRSLTRRTLPSPRACDMFRTPAGHTPQEGRNRL